MGNVFIDVPLSRAVLQGTKAAIAEPASSYSGADIRVAAYVPPDKTREVITASGTDEETKRASGYFKEFAELQTISITSHRGIAPVRRLGESWAADYVRGTRTFGGTLVFSILDRDVLTEIMSLDKNESFHPYPSVADQLPPMTITIQAINEKGTFASMGLFEVVLINQGMTLSIDDMFTETTYSYVAQWVTPFMDVDTRDVIAQALTRRRVEVAPLSSRVTVREAGTPRK